MRVTAPNAKTGEQLKYTFTGLDSGCRTSQRIHDWYRNNSLNLYNDPVPASYSTFQDYTQFREAIGSRVMVSNFATVPNPRDVSQALNRGGIAEVPVQALWSRSSEPDYEVSGTVSLVNDSEGKVSIQGNTLKCLCPDYQENYDCLHVRATMAHALHVPQIGQREPVLNTRTHNQVRANHLNNFLDYDTLDLYGRMSQFRSLHPELNEEQWRGMLLKNESQNEKQNGRELAKIQKQTDSVKRNVKNDTERRPKTGVSKSRPILRRTPTTPHRWLHSTGT